MSDLNVFDLQRFSIHDGPGIRTTVFLKGCPLRCPWCANPESQSALPELLHEGKKCAGCGRCAAACPHGAVSRERSGLPRFDRERCRACGVCAKVCLSGALRICGRRESAEDILATVLRDRAYYQNSGGGLTLSGGEPFLQRDGARSLLEGAKGEGLHTAVETCAAVDADRLASLSGLLDLYLIDIKHPDAAVLRRRTGGDLARMLEGLAAVAAHGPEKVIIRTPVVPGFNFTEEAVEGVFRIALEHGVERVHLLPYHNLGAVKYEGLGRAYPMGDVPMLTRADLLPFQARGEAKGLEVRIGG